MSTFMSSTDLNTLLQEGTDRNIFVSLIVNNEGNYTAGITRRIFSKIAEEKCYKTFNDREICKPEEHYETQYVEWFNLDIEKEEDYSNPFPEITERLLSIAEEKKRQKEEREKHSKENNSWWQPYQPTLFDNVDSFNKITESKKKKEEVDDFPELFDEGDFKINKELFNNIIIKLLTGDINANSSTTTTSKAAVNMPLLFDRTFEDISEFEAFAGNFIEFIMDIWGDKVYIPKQTEVDENWEEGVTALAYNLGNRLLEIVPNKYTEVYSNVLNAYI